MREKNLEFRKLLLEEKIEKALEILRENDLDVNQTDHHDNTLLCMMIVMGKLESAKFLINEGADLEVEIIGGRNAFDLACQMGDKGLLEALKKKTGYKWLERKKNTIFAYPTFIAAHNDNHETLEWLLENGADLNIGSGIGFSIINILEGKSKEIVAVLDRFIGQFTEENKRKYRAI